MSVASVALSPVHEEFWNFPGRYLSQHGPWPDDSILIYLTIGDSLIPIHVHESDSIASVKLRIQKYNKGFFVKNQKLVFEGKELVRNNSRVRDYGIVDGNTLHLVLRLSDLQAIAVRTVCGEEFEFLVQRKRNIAYVKQQIAKRGNGYFEDQELLCNGVELEDQRIIGDLCTNNDAVIHFFVRKSAKIKMVPLEKDLEVSILALDGNANADEVESESDLRTQPDKFPIVTSKPVRKESLIEPLHTNPSVVLSLVMKKFINATIYGLEKGNNPIRSSEGSGGVYFMQDSTGQNYVSVFKPIDEEPMAINNPRGLPMSSNGEGLKKGTRVGEGAIREVAAYILDHPRGGRRSILSNEKGFSGVPPTIMVKCGHQGFHYAQGFDRVLDKFGSLQMFVKNRGSCEDIGPRAFPVQEVHKICVLDIRLANTDRHAGNILIHEKTEDGHMILVPIDHGYCLPENFEDCTFEWLYWPQARQPFSSDTIAYINALDADKDIELLKFHGWDVPESCALVYRISTMLLKKGVERGLTPYTIGSIMCRETVRKESVIEKMVHEAEETVLPGTSKTAFLESVATVMDRYLDGFSHGP